MTVALTISDRGRYPKRATNATRNHPLKVDHAVYAQHHPSLRVVVQPDRGLRHPQRFRRRRHIRRIINRTSQVIVRCRRGSTDGLGVEAKERFYHPKR